MNRLFQTLALAIALGGAGWLIYRAQTQAQPAAPAPASATSVQPPSVTSAASAAQSSSAESDVPAVKPAVKPAVMGSSKLIVLPEDVVPKPPPMLGSSKSLSDSMLLPPKIPDALKGNAQSSAPKSNAPKSNAPKSKAPFMGSSKFAPNALPVPPRPAPSK